MSHLLKILHLNASDKGGAFQVANNLVENLNQSEGIYAHHLVYTGKNSNFKFTKINLLDKIIKFGLHAFEKLIFLFYQKNKKYRFIFSLGYPGIPWFILKKKIEEYDIIHLHWINKGFINLHTLLKINKPVVWTCHDIWPATGGCHLTFGCENYKSECGNCPMLKNSNINDLSHVLNITKKNIYSGLDLNFITPSQWLSNQLKSSSLLNKANVRVINNGVDTNLFSIKDDISRIKNDFVIGFVSQNLNDENKSFHRLLEACSLLKNNTNVKLLLIGELKQPIDIQYQNEIVSNVTSKYDMVKYYQKMDIIVNTSTIETYPTTLMEAACCGVQCVGFNVGGVGEILNMCEGYSVNPFDINELSQKIETLQSATINRIKISQIAKENFSYYKMTDRYIDLYKSLTSQSQ